MATTKTLTPTNQAITIAAFTEKPDNRVNATNDDKLADAVNALNSKITTQSAMVAKADANYTYGNVKFEKTANYVSILIEGLVSLPAQGYTDICAIPAEFAPSATKYFDVLVGTNETGENIRYIRFRINGTKLSAYNYSTELTNANAQPIVTYMC